MRMQFKMKTKMKIDGLELCHMNRVPFASWLIVVSLFKPNEI